jgi:hypothetical protein
VKNDDLEKVKNAGLVYGANIPVKKAGGYQLRAVVRDSGNQHIGSAMQFIEVPDVKKNRLTLSGIVMGATLPKAGEADSTASMDRTQVEGMPAVRIFKSGTLVNYAYKVLNATLDVDKKPQLESQIRLYRDGRLMYASRGSSVVSQAAEKGKQLVITGQMQLNKIAPGDYTLQVIVEDNLRHDKYRLAAQAMDFQVRG